MHYSTDNPEQEFLALRMAAHEEAVYSHTLIVPVSFSWTAMRRRQIFNGVGEAAGSITEEGFLIDDVLVEGDFRLALHGGYATTAGEANPGERVILGTTETPQHSSALFAGILNREGRKKVLGQQPDGQQRIKANFAERGIWWQVASDEQKLSTVLFQPKLLDMIAPLISKSENELAASFKHLEATDPGVLLAYLKNYGAYGSFVPAADQRWGKGLPSRALEGLLKSNSRQIRAGAIICTRNKLEKRHKTARGHN